MIISKINEPVEVQRVITVKDKFGSQVRGVIEYDSVKEEGKRVIDPETGTISKFHNKGGWVEVDGTAFSQDEKAEDENVFEGIKQSINMRFSKQERESIVQQIVNEVRQRGRQQQLEREKGPHS